MVWSMADKNITSSKATYTAQKRRSGLKVASGCVWAAPVCVWAAPGCVGAAAWAEADAGAVAGVEAVAGAAAVADVGAPARFCVLIFLPFPGSFWE